MISPSSLKEKNIIDNVDNVEENGDCFFKILVKIIFYKKKIDNINEVIILNIDNDDYKIDNNDNNIVNNTYTIFLSAILDEIASFAAFISKGVKQNAEKIAEEAINIDYLHAGASIEKRYDKEFDNYLCSYLLYYLAKEIEAIKAIKKVKIKNYKSNHKHEKTYRTIFADKTQSCCTTLFTKKYNIDFNITKKILEKLFKDKLIK